MFSENVHQVFFFFSFFCPEGRQQYGAMCFLLFRVWRRCTWKGQEPSIIFNGSGVLF